MSALVDYGPVAEAFAARHAGSHGHYADGIVARALEIAEGAEKRSEKQSRNGTRAVQMGLFK